MGEAINSGSLTEADTCRLLVTPGLHAAGWGQPPTLIGEQRSFTDGRIMVTGGIVRRGKQKRPDYILFYRRDFPIAVVEAKEATTPAEDGVQQAKEYAEILGLKFAYATNGHRIIEIDYLTGRETEITSFPSAEMLWQRLAATRGLDDDKTTHLLEPFNLISGKVPRYYQRIAIHGVTEAILLGQRRILVTMATGSGKTDVAFQLCWLLWKSRWNRTGEYRRPKILFLADRNILVKPAQRAGDATYWPVYNLDLKNPHAKACLAHADPIDLVASMRAKEQEVMRLLLEIEALVSEVPA